MIPLQKHYSCTCTLGFEDENSGSSPGWCKLKSAEGDELESQCAAYFGCVESLGLDGHVLHRHTVQVREGLLRPEAHGVQDVLKVAVCGHVSHPGVDLEPIV